MTRTYGIISELHKSDIHCVPLALHVFKREEVNALILNGDLIGEQSGNKPKEYFATVLDQVGKSGLETYILPGSHEPLLIFGPILDTYCAKYANLVDTTKISKVDHSDHSLVFIPGSDSQGEFHTGVEPIKTGKYVHFRSELLSFNSWEECVEALQKGFENPVYYTNLNDLKRMITQPERTIVVSHVPRRFHNLETGVDMADFGVLTEPFTLKEAGSEQHLPQGLIAPYHDALYLKKRNASIEFKKENRGSFWKIKKVYQRCFYQSKNKQSVQDL